MEMMEKEPTYTANKYAGSRLRYNLDWTDFTPELLASDWVVPPGLTKESEDFNGAVATIEISGGTEDTWYTLVNSVTAENGEIDQRLVSVYIKKAAPASRLVTTTLPKYTSYDDIRGVLSVTDEELEDGTLALPNFESQLFEQMREVAPGLQQLYLDTLQVANQSAEEARLVRLTRVFSTYAVCVQLLDALPLLAIKSDQDARAQYERFEKPFERVEPAVRAAFEVAKRRLLDAYNDVATTPVNRVSPVITMFTSTGLATDPVTG